MNFGYDIMSAVSGEKKQSVTVEPTLFYGNEMLDDGKETEKDADLNTEPTEKESVSICISAYRAKKYIFDSLNSIDTQTYFADGTPFEIIVCVDGCEETLNAIIEKRHLYRNLRILYMPENKGTYIATNTAMSQAKYDKIIRFDADDVMLPTMVSEIMNAWGNADAVRFMMSNMNEDLSKTSGEQYAHGQIGITKEAFERFGGYKPWPCGADTEMITRIMKRGKIKIIKKSLLKRRLHDDSLTRSKETGMSSPLRKKLADEIAKTDYKKDENVFLGTPATYNFEEIKPNITTSITSFKGDEENVVTTIKSMQSQTMVPGDSICYLSYLEYDGRTSPEEIRNMEKTEECRTVWIKKDFGVAKRLSVLGRPHNGPVFTLDAGKEYPTEYIRSMYAACIEFPESVICASKSEDEFSCGLCAFPKDGFNGIMENVSKYKSIERCKDDSDFMINYLKDNNIEIKYIGII